MTSGFEPAWVAGVRTTADSLEAELRRAPTPTQPSADFDITYQAIERARYLARRPALDMATASLPGVRQWWRRFGAWWTGAETDGAWACLHNAGQALLSIEAGEVVKAQLADTAANVATALSEDDLRVKSYLATLQLLAQPTRVITEADRAQLRAIRQACDSSSDGAHADARAYRNTLIQLCVTLAVVLGAVAGLAALDPGFRSVFAPAKSTPGGWYVLELELIASLAGLSLGVFSLKNYRGFQSTYGLPFVQAFLKGGTGAATGLFGVALVQGGIITSLQPQSGGGVFATAIVFGYAQYLFTRLVDQQANKILGSASSRNDPGTTAQVPTGTNSLDLTTTDPNPTPAPQVQTVPLAPTPPTPQTPPPAAFSSE